MLLLGTGKVVWDRVFWGTILPLIDKDTHLKVVEQQHRWGLAFWIKL